MLVELKQLDGKQVGAMDEGTAVGSVYKVIASPDDLKVIGFEIKIGAFLGKIQAVSFSDVVDIDQNGIAIHSKENLVDRKEIVRLFELVRKKYSLIGSPVKTRSGKKLGTVSDALIESTSGDIVRIYIKSIFRDLVFERSQIYKATLRGVVVKDEMGIAKVKKVPATGEATELA